MKRYFDGKTHVVRCADWTDLDRKRQALYRAARKAGVKISTRAYPDNRRFEFRAEVGA